MDRFWEVFVRVEELLQHFCSVDGYILVNSGVPSHC